MNCAKESGYLGSGSEFITLWVCHLLTAPRLSALSVKEMNAIHLGHVPRSRVRRMQDCVNVLCLHRFAEVIM